MTLRDLGDLRVADLSTGIAGPYCTKLLADAGADVVKIEPAGGDPLRRWTATGADRGEEDSVLFRFLNASKRGVTGELGDPHVMELLFGADVVVESFAPGVIERLELMDRHPSLVVVSISPFGRGGPWSERPATDLTLQAICGSVGSRGVVERTPLQAGGRLGEWIGGAYAAVAALAAAWAARAHGRGEHVDVSLLDCMSVSMNTYAALFASFYGWKPPAYEERPRDAKPVRTIEIPSIEPTRDGYVGLCTITAQQFRDFLVLIERPDLMDDRDLATAAGRSNRLEEVQKIIHAWTKPRSTDEVIELASLLRLPVAPVANGATVTELEQFRGRGTFVESADGGFVQPRAPWRMSDREPRPFAPAPTLGRDDGAVDWPRRPVPDAGAAVDGDRSLPLDGLRIVDLTAFWAGPAATHVLAALGADVVKVESVQRPDGMRFTTAAPKAERWWEWGPVFHGANTNKRSVTLDLSRPQGVELFERLLAGADALVENFTPRVMENFGLDWDRIAQVNPRLVMVRMPGFGLGGPWRDRTGFAQTMEQVSGLAWVTGYPDGPPVIPRGACDPFAGLHAAFALLVALVERERTGAGRLVEVTMVEAALNAAAAQVAEWTAYGRLAEREGNRSQLAAPQGVYACHGEEQWLALAVVTDEQWQALLDVMGDPVGLRDPSLGDAAGRRRAHDEIDRVVEAWTGQHDVDDVVERLAAAGVPAGAVLPPHESVIVPQLRARGLFERIDHPVTGVHEIPGVPFRFASHAGGWLRRPAPTLGQHNDEVLGGELGLSAVELDALRADAVIGEAPVRA